MNFATWEEYRRAQKQNELKLKLQDTGLDTTPYEDESQCPGVRCRDCGQCYTCYYPAPGAPWKYFCKYTVVTVGSPPAESVRFEWPLTRHYWIKTDWRCAW